LKAKTGHYSSEIRASQFNYANCYSNFKSEPFKPER
jgi:hypothetical protein